MNQSEILRRKRENYDQMLSNMIRVQQRLQRGIEKLDSVANKVITGYSIEEESADQNKLQNYKEEAKNLRNQLINIIIPALENKIGQLNEQISDALIKEELERNMANHG